MMARQKKAAGAQVLPQRAQEIRDGTAPHPLLEVARVKQFVKLIQHDKNTLTRMTQPFHKHHNLPLFGACSTCHPCVYSAISTRFRMCCTLKDGIEALQDSRDNVRQCGIGSNTQPDKVL